MAEDQTTNNDSSSVESINNTDSKPNAMQEIRQALKNAKAEAKAEKEVLLKRVEELEEKNLINQYGEQWKDAQKMINGGLSENRVKELLNNTKELDPEVKVDEEALKIKPQQDNEIIKKQDTQEQDEKKLRENIFAGIEENKF